VPLQLLADLGVLGLALGVAFAGGAAVAIRRGLRRLEGPEREAAAALVCLPAVYGVHALVDYDLDFLAVTAPALLVCGVLFGAARPAVRFGAPLLTAAAAAATAVAVIVVLVSPALADRNVDRSARLLDEGRLAAAASAADRARSLDPLSLDPVYAAAAAADRAGNNALARALYRRATEMQPENPEPWITLGLYELAGRGDMCRAYAALNAAYTLDPNGRVWVPGGPLDVAKDAVNAGACEKS
jgi:tetratricopeptide (TPR) repeat protein